MKNPDQISIVVNMTTQDKLDSMNAALMMMDSQLTHLMWCGGTAPFLTPLIEFKPGDEPIVSWTAKGTDDDVVGQVELHHNRFGWILARLWTRNDWRRRGLARTLWSTALDYAFGSADEVGAFCDLRNYASKSLQLSMGFRPTMRWVDNQIELLTISKVDYDIYKWAVAPLVKPQKPVLTPCANLLQFAQSNPATS